MQLGPSTPLIKPELLSPRCPRSATTGELLSRSDGASDTMAVRVATKKVAGRALVGLAPRGGASSMRPASIGAVSALRPQQQCQSRALHSKERSKSVYEYGAHRSDAEARIAEVPVVMVDGPVALCDGGGGALGHPLDYIQLGSPDGGPRACQYCGIMYQMKAH